MVKPFYLSELKLAQDQQAEREQWDQQKMAILAYIETIHQAVSNYDEAMKNNKNHDIENVTKKIESFKLLNNTIRKPIDKLLTNNQLKESKTTIFSPTTNQVAGELTSVITKLNQTIREIAPQQRIVLALEDQK